MYTNNYYKWLNAHYKTDPFTNYVETGIQNVSNSSWNATMGSDGTDSNKRQDHVSHNRKFDDGLKIMVSSSVQTPSKSSYKLNTNIINLQSQTITVNYDIINGKVVRNLIIEVTHNTDATINTIGLFKALYCGNNASNSADCMFLIENKRIYLTANQPKTIIISLEEE